MSAKYAREQKRIARQEAAEKRKALAQQTSPTLQKSLPAVKPIAIDQLPFKWTMKSIDHTYTGAWDWKLSAEEVRHLLEVLESLGEKTWREVKDMKTNSKRRTRALHHDQPIESIDKAAQDRLRELKLDVESVFRLRHGNLIRVWGYLQGGTFHLVWFDRGHKVCPSEG